MQIKRYFGKTFAQVMERVENEHGKNAVILHVNKMREPGFMGFFKPPIIEALVSCEQASSAPEPVAPPLPLPSPDGQHSFTVKDDDAHLTQRISFLEKLVDQMQVRTRGTDLDPLAHASEPGDTPMIAFLRTKLAEQEVSPFNIKELCAVLAQSDTQSKDMFEGLEKIFSGFFENPGPILANLPENEPVRVVFAGPPGAGKTTSMAKLAFHLKLGRGVSVAMVNCDTTKISADIEIKKYGEFSRIHTYSVFSPSEIPGLFSRLSNTGVICFDTSAVNSANKEEMDLLAGFVEVIQPHLTVLTVDNGSSSAFARRTVSGFIHFPGLCFLFTKLDQTPEIGTLVNLMMDHKAIPAYCTFERDVLADIEPVGIQWMVKQLLETDLQKDLSQAPAFSFQTDPMPARDPAVVPFPRATASKSGFSQSEEPVVKDFFQVLAQVDEKTAGLLRAFFEKTDRLGLVLAPANGGLAMKTPDGKKELAMFTRNGVVKFMNVAPTAKNAGMLDKARQYLTALAHTIEAARLVGADDGLGVKKQDNRFLSILECLEHEQTWLKAIEAFVDRSGATGRQMPR